MKNYSVLCESIVSGLEPRLTKLLHRSRRIETNTSCGWITCKLKTNIILKPVTTLTSQIRNEFFSFFCSLDIWPLSSVYEGQTRRLLTAYLRNYFLYLFFDCLDCFTAKQNDDWCYNDFSNLPTRWPSFFRFDLQTVSRTLIQSLWDK